jgi:hypothetical protein
MGATSGLSLGAIGCLSDDTSLSPPVKDAGLFFDSSAPTFDAGGLVDGAGIDAGLDSSLPDATPPPVDAGKDASGISQLGVVAGGTVSHSPSYTMTGTTGPATAPVLRSPHYTFVGGMSVSTKP